MQMSKAVLWVGPVSARRQALGFFFVALAAGIWVPAAGAESQESGLQVVVIEGQDRVNVVGEGTSVPVVVEVRDRDDLAVAGAEVVFEVEEGGTATLNVGLTRVETTTNALGQASVTVNLASLGAVEVAVRATFGDEVATAVIRQTNVLGEGDPAEEATGPEVETSPDAPDAEAGGGGPGAGMILGLIGGAGAAAVAALAAGGDDASGTSGSAPAPPPAPPATPPSAVSAPMLTPGDRRLEVSWAAPSDGGSPINDYDVRYRLFFGAWTELADTRRSTATSATITGLRNGTAYQVQVRAGNSAGDGPWSESATATPATVPSAPTALEVVGGDEQLEVSWTAPSDNGSPILAYIVAWRPLGDDWGTGLLSLETEVTLGPTSYVHLPNGITWEVQVQAQNAVGIGPASPIVQGRTFGLPAAPAAPDVTGRDGQLEIRWTAPSDNGSPIDDYDVRYRGSGGSWSHLPDTEKSTATSVTILHLRNGFTFEVQVRAGNAAGDGPWSPSGSAATGARRVPGRPSAPRLTAGDGQLEVRWTAPANNGTSIDDYDVRYRPVGRTWTELPDTRKSTARNATIRNLRNGTEYEVQVRAGNTAGDGPWSPSASGRPRATAGPGNVPFVGMEVEVRHSGPTVGCLDVVGGNTSGSFLRNGQPVRTWHCNGTDAQKWRLEQRAGGDHAGRYRLVSALLGGNRFCLDNEGVFRDSDHEVSIYTCHADTAVDVVNQTFDLTPSGDGWTLTFTRGNSSAVMWARRSLGNPVGPVGQRSGGTGTRAEWQFVTSALTQLAPQRAAAALPGLSVLDATVAEGANAMLAFTVALDRALVNGDNPVSVDYVTRSGTAMAGSDFAAVSGALNFAVGERTKTVQVPVLDDAHDEGLETLELVLSNASGATLTDGTGVGTITNADLLPAALLARFGRAAAGQVVDQIEQRMTSARARGFRARLAGRELRSGGEHDFAAGLLASFSQRAGMHPAGSGRADLAPGGGAGVGTEAHGGDLAGLFADSEFEFNREHRGSVVSLWSRSARSWFGGDEGALALNGDVRTTMIGADYRRGPLTVGLSVNRSLGVGNYDGPSAGVVTSAMTGFFPWVSYQVGDRLAVWGVTGFGTGTLGLTSGSERTLETGMGMAMTAAGTRGDLLGSPGGGGFALAFKADALWVGAFTRQVTGDGTSGRLNASEAGSTRLRAALEGSRHLAVGTRLSLTPSVEVGVRQDGGDAETGAGLELGGGLVLSDSVLGLSLDLRMRTLVVHQAEGFQDQGLALSLDWDPTPSSPLGLRVRLAPQWSGQAQSGAGALWGRDTMTGFNATGVAPGNRFSGEVGYGLPLGTRFAGIPRFGFGTSEHGRDLRLGYGMTMLATDALRFDFRLDAQRRISPLREIPDRALLGHLTLGW